MSAAARASFAQVYEGPPITCLKDIGTYFLLSFFVKKDIEDTFVFYVNHVPGQHGLAEALSGAVALGAGGGRIL